MIFSIRPIDWFAAGIIAVFLIPIVVIDIKRYTIPDFLVLLGAAVLFSYYAAADLQRLLPALVHGTLGFSVIFLFWFLFKKQIGLGDAKLSFFLAAGLGFFEWWGALLIASLAGMVFGLVKIALKKSTMKDKLPMAPFFAVGAAGIIVIKIVILNAFPDLLKSFGI